MNTTLGIAVSAAIHEVTQESNVIRCVEAMLVLAGIGPVVHDMILDELQHADLARLHDLHSMVAEELGYTHAALTEGDGRPCRANGSAPKQAVPPKSRLCEQVTNAILAADPATLTPRRDCTRLRHQMASAMDLVSI